MVPSIPGARTVTAGPAMRTSDCIARTPGSMKPQLRKWPIVAGSALTSLATSFASSAGGSGWRLNIQPRSYHSSSTRFSLGGSVAGSRPCSWSGVFSISGSIGCCGGSGFSDFRVRSIPPDVQVLFLEADRLDDLRPLRLLCCDERGVFLRRAWGRDAADLGELLV